jgi:FtsH-binding integral membrane protein
MAVAAAPLLSHAQLRHELRARPWLLALATGSALAALCGMTWAEATRRCPARGLLMLAGFSAVAGVATGVSGSVVGSHAPMLALLLTAAAALALVCYAGQTSVDFSPPGATIVAAAALFGCVSAADSRLGFSTRQLLEGGCAALVMSAWIIVDVSAAAAGEGWHSLAPHEVIFAACNVYTDLITCVRWLLLRLATALRGGHEREWCMV